MTALSVFKDLLNYKNLLSLRGLSLVIPSALMADSLGGSMWVLGTLAYIILLALIYTFTSSYSYGVTVKVAMVNLAVELRSNILVRPSVWFGGMIAVFLCLITAVSLTMYPAPESETSSEYVDIVQIIKDHPVAVLIVLVIEPLVKMSLWAFSMFAMLATLNSSINVQAQETGRYYAPFECFGMIFGSVRRTCWVGFGLLFLQSVVVLVLINHPLMAGLMSTLLLFFIFTWIVSVVIAEIGGGRYEKQECFQEDSASSLEIVKQH